MRFSLENDEFSSAVKPVLWKVSLLLWIKEEGDKNDTSSQDGAFFAPKMIAKSGSYGKFPLMKQAQARPKTRRGRAASGESTVRISPRFPASTAALLERASALRGLTVTGFILEAARAAAERVVTEETRWQLGESETSALLKLLANPPKPNTAARKAAALAADVTIRS